MPNRLTKQDLSDLDFLDAAELAADGSTSYRTGVSVVSTTASTKRVVLTSGAAIIHGDDPVEVGDRVVLTGNAAAGTYTVALVVDDETFDVVEAIVDSTGGSAAFRYVPGARRIGFNPSGVPGTVATNVQEALSDVANNASGISASTHRTLLQLIHFIDGGPAEGFTTGATRTMTGTSFPSQILWRRADSTKLVEKNLTYTGAFPTTIEWKIYDTDGSTVLATVTDTITYSGAFETTRTRAIA